jgi:hypothetical protein
LAGVRLINRWQFGGLWLQCYTVAERIEKRIQCTEFRYLPDDMLIIVFKCDLCQMNCLLDLGRLQL